MKWRGGLWREVGILAASTNPDGREHSEDDGPADGALQGKNSYENKLHISGNNNLTPSRVGRRIFTFPSVEGIILPYSASDITNMLSSIQMAFCSALPACQSVASFHRGRAIMGAAGACLNWIIWMLSIGGGEREGERKRAQ